MNGRRGCDAALAAAVCPYLVAAAAAGRSEA